MSLSGINPENLNSLCFEVQEYAERIYNVLDQIGDIIDSSRSSFKGDIASDYYPKFDEMRESFMKVNKNVMSYIDEFHKLSTRFSDNDVELALQLEKNTVTLEEEE